MLIRLLIATWAIVSPSLCFICWQAGYKRGCMPGGVPKMDNPPPPPISKGIGYQPTSDVLTDPPTGGSGVPNKLS
jgi:hypothetical protein